MKHYFIVNPAAGKQNSADRLMQEIGKYADRYDIEIHETTAPRDATEFVRRKCSENPDEDMRFYACGGDGTLSEVVNGAVGFSNASVTCYPCGSGDDFVKYYGGRENFLDMEALLTAKDDLIDVLSINDSVYSINVVNFGFDTKVCKTMIKVRRRKIIGGKRAYVTGIVTALITAMKNKCAVTADGELLNPKGKILLCTLANGAYVGGSFYCAPRSVNNDGLIDVALFRPLSRFTFVKLLPVYTKGGHLDDPRFRKYFEYRRVKSVSITAPEGFSLTVDGEILDGTEFTVSVLPKALRFAVPAGCTLIGGRSGEKLPPEETASL
jgi:diacylglycerol kinase (ATP)